MSVLGLLAVILVVVFWARLYWLSTDDPGSNYRNRAGDMNLEARRFKKSPTSRTFNRVFFGGA